MALVDANIVFCECLREDAMVLIISLFKADVFVRRLWIVRDEM